MNRAERTPKDRVLRPIRPNAGIHDWYRDELDDAISEMQQSIMFWVKARYRSAGLPETAMDATPASELQRELHKLTKRWQVSFDKLAGWLGAELARKVLNNSDAALTGGLKEKGLKVKFTMSPEMENAYKAVQNEQVQLIKSIASEHLSDVEGLVMRSVARGRDLGTLSKSLQKRYSLTRKRAALIARDQNNKATSTIQAARQTQLGITEGIWKHSHAGRHPRPSHVKANGSKFPLDKGMFLDGEWLMPGEAINCRCTWSPVIPGLD